MQCRRPGFDPWFGKIPGEGNGNSLQYSCLENSWTVEPGGLQSVGLLFQILFLYTLLENIEYSSLCYIVGPCLLSIVYIVECVYLCQTPNLSSTLLSLLVTMNFFFFYIHEFFGISSLVSYFRFYKLVLSLIFVFLCLTYFI